LSETVDFGNESKGPPVCTVAAGNASVIGEREQMAISYPIDVARPGAIRQGPGAWSAALSWGNAYRALEAGFAVLVPGHWLGDNAWGPAGSVDEIEGLVISWDHPDAKGAFLAVMIPRDAELCDAFIDYVGLDRAAVNERLRSLGMTGP